MSEELKKMMYGIYSGMFEDMTKEWRRVKDAEIKELRKYRRLAEKDILRLKEKCNRITDVYNEYIFEMNAERHNHNLLVIQMQVRITSLENEINDLKKKEQ